MKNTEFFKKTFKGIEVKFNEMISDDELNSYIDYIKEKNHNRNIKSIELEFDGEEVTLRYLLEPMKFEKIRRITGYLVGTLDRFNNGKASEERDRVKHM